MLPCSCNSISGTIDIIDDGTSGMLFAVNDERSFVDAMAPLLNEADSRKKIGARASAEIHERLSSNKSAERYLRLYQSMLEGR